MTMLSRVAASIFWMARYVERAENTARLINVNTHLLLDLPKRVRLGWEPIIDITASRELFFQSYSEPDERSVVRFLISNTGNPGSILNSLAMARENARTIRDIIPREGWEHINQMYLQAKGDVQNAFTQRKRYDYLRGLILNSQTATGLLAGTMTHDEGYDFLRMGRNLERADMTTRIIDVRTASLLPQMAEELTPFENIQWMSVLKSLTAYQMYRRAMRLRVGRRDVLRFLFHDGRFPRAVNHALAELESCLNNLPRHDEALSTLKSLQRTIAATQPESLHQQALHEFIDDVQLALGQIGNQITETYF